MKKLEIFNRRYLGSKQRLVNFIHESLDKECPDFDSIIDIFAGTGSVAYSYNDSKKVIVNDMLKFNYYAYQVWFGSGYIDDNKVNSLIEFYNTLIDIEDNYFSINFADTYFSKNDTKKIGYIRDDIEIKFAKNEINEYERSYLISSLIYSMDRIANTVGHYDAYRKIGKLEDKFVMCELEYSRTYNKDNEIYCKDANELIREIRGDVLYIDPPYNSRQYCDAYHLLENVALWEKPKLSGVALKMDRDSMKSDYCGKKALKAFTDLIKNANVKYIVVSYNNMYDRGVGRSQAILKESDILSVLSSKGRVVVYEKDFQPFTTGKTNIDNHKERLYICHVAENSKDLKIETEKKFVKSPLNYTGGKFKIIEELNNIFPNNIGTFVDLFCGGANVGVNVNANKVLCYDNNKDLIELFNYLKGKTFLEVNEKIESIISKFSLSYSYLNGYEYYNCSSSDGLGSYNKKGYAELKSYYNQNKDFIDRPLYLLILIIYGFNNQIRYNKNNDFNIPVGKRDYNNKVRTNLSDFILKLNSIDISFEVKDFRSFDVSLLSSNDFVYLDPPYLLGCATYNESNGWTEQDEKDMYKLLEQLDSKGVKFALSNVIQHKGKNHNLLNDFAIKNRLNINFIDRNYNNASYHIKDKGLNQTCEVVITNY